MRSRAAEALLVSVLLVGVSPRSGASSLVPIEAFARTPYIAQVSISPDKRFLAFVMSTADLRSVIVHDRSGELAPRNVWTSQGRKDFDVRWCGWANATRLLCSAVTTLGEKPAVDSPRSGYLFRATRLIAVNFDGSESTVLLSKPPASRAAYQDQILNWTPEDDDTVLIQLRTYDSTSVFRLNVYTSALEAQTELLRPTEFRSDQDGNVRLARVINDNATTTYHRRLLGESAWRPWAVITYREQPEEFEPLALITDTNRFLGARLLRGRRALWDVDFERRRGPELIFASPEYDVGDLVITRAGTVLGVDYHNTRPATHYLDSRARSVIDGANRFLPDAFNSIHDMTADGSAYIVRSSSDVDAGTFHLLDVSSGPAPIEQLGTSYPELHGHALGRMKAVEYPARDGIKIPAYLTLPAAPFDKPTPLIVVPHDGPAGRTTWEFDYLRAFLASRGYAVLEMNYRGSSGYGWAWEHAGYREWNGRIYSDIAAGARWAINEGIADRKRVCIAGMGFGGYQALLGAVHDSEMYRCAISVGGWSNLADAKIYAQRGLTGSFNKKEMGSNSTRLLLRSPIRYVEEIRIPILLAHAELDWNIPVSQSRSMAKQLERLCKPHQLLIISETDQTLRWQSDRMTLLSGIEKFLETSLAAGGAPTPVIDGRCKSSAVKVRS